MSVDSERKLQDRVKGWLINDLHYIFLGNLSDVNNTPIREDLLRKNLINRGYDYNVINKAISDLTMLAANQTDELYPVNQAVYEKLRYGDQGIRDDRGNRVTVHYIDWTDT